MKNFYKVLGAHTLLTDNEIRERYRKLTRQHHPDRGGDASKFAEVTEAYAVIGTAKQRNTYRATLALQAPMCDSCSGAGCTQRQKGFTAVEYIVCDACHGAGYDTENAATARPVRRSRK